MFGCPKLSKSLEVGSLAHDDVTCNVTYVKTKLGYVKASSGLD